MVQDSNCRFMCHVKQNVVLFGAFESQPSSVSDLGIKAAILQKEIFCSGSDEAIHCENL